jgi:hypothetical protein
LQLHDRDDARLSKAAGFSLHAGVAADAHQHDKSAEALLKSLAACGGY